MRVDSEQTSTRNNILKGVRVNYRAVGVLAVLVLCFSRQIGDINDFVSKDVEIQQQGQESFIPAAQTSEVVVSDSSGSQEAVRYPSLIDFAIVGFGKCATTSLMNFFDIPDKTYMGFNENDGRLKREKCPSSINAAKRLYGKHVNTTIMKGLKCPMALWDATNVIKTFQEVNPNPKMIATIRHPVTHFQSSYNYFYSKNYWGKKRRPNPVDLLGHCLGVCDYNYNSEDDGITLQIKDDDDNRQCLTKESVGQPIWNKVCSTRSSMFHLSLSKLHLTPMTDDDELDLLEHHSLDTFSDYKGTLFVMESKQVVQMSNVNNTEIRDSLERYIGMEPGTLQGRPFPGSDSYAKIMNICDDEYKPLRDELVLRGRKAGRWIIDYLLKSDRVVVYDRENFIELVEAWGVDPCA